MSNNYWQTQNNPNGQAGPENQPRKSGLLSNYAGQPPAQSPLPQANNPVPQGPPPSSPFPLAPNQSQGPAPYRPMGQPSQQQLPSPQQQWNGPAFMERPMQMVQRLSAKMAAMRRSGQQSVDPGPMVRYRGPQLPAPITTKPVPTRAMPWRRSRTQRITHLRKKRVERWRKTGPGSRRIGTIITSVILGLLIMLLTSTAGYAYNFYTSELPQVQGLANGHISQSTHIYDRHGVLLTTLYDNTAWGASGRSTPVTYDYLPGVLQDAQTAAEDPTFWNNNGIDPQGILRALTEYASHGGQVSGGGSTLTQQLIKNLSHNADPSFQRKASEAALAIGLTQQYPKWKILEMYFNVSPYGVQDKGVEAATEDFFGIPPQCDLTTHKCIPAVAFLDRDMSDMSKCTNPKDMFTCPSDPILGLARAAMLAGIPQNPTHNDPTVNNDTYTHLMTVRLPYVLEQMKADSLSINLGLGDPAVHKIDKGLITDDIIAQVEAKAKNIKIVGFRQTLLAPHFVNWVIGNLIDTLGTGTDPNDHFLSGKAALLNGGFNIYTTLDLNLEQFVEKDIKHNLRDNICQPYTGCKTLNKTYNVNDSAAVVMDAKTGEVLAMNGSADYNDNSPPVSGNVNAALSFRQPGSSIKPIIYAAAFEKGWYPGIKLIDGKTYFPRGANQNLLAKDSTYTPTDYQKSYHPTANTNIRISLANSFNIPAIKAFMYAGIDSVADMAKRMGITALDTNLSNYNTWAQKTGHRTNNLDQLFGPSMALGTPGIPLIQMVGAYQVLANDGVRVPYHNILDIWDNYGHNLYHYDPAHPNGARVLSQQITFLLDNMLSDNPSRRMEFGNLQTLTMSDEPGNAQVAAKTGTTDSFVDNWTLGFTSSLVVGVWSGNANGGNPMGNGVIGITGAGPIWHDIIEYATGFPKLGMTPDAKYPANPFPQPGGVIKASVNTINGLKGTGNTDWMLENEQPQQAGLPACNPNPDPNNPNPNPNPSPTDGSCPPPNGNGNGNSDIFDNGNPFGG